MNFTYKNWILDILYFSLLFLILSDTFPTAYSAPPTPNMSYQAPLLVPTATSTPEEQRSEAVGADSR